eukprot:2151891-Rhodomonas_salina.3
MCRALSTRHSSLSLSLSLSSSLPLVRSSSRSRSLPLRLLLRLSPSLSLPLPVHAPSYPPSLLSHVQPVQQQTWAGKGCVRAGGGGCEALRRERREQVDGLQHATPSILDHTAYTAHSVLAETTRRSARVHPAAAVIYGGGLCPRCALTCAGAAHSALLERTAATAWYSAPS